MHKRSMSVVAKTFPQAKANLQMALAESSCIPPRGWPMVSIVMKMNEDDSSAIDLSQHEYRSVCKQRFWANL